MSDRCRMAVLRAPGNVGLATSRTLAEHGHDVLAEDGHDVLAEDGHDVLAVAREDLTPILGGVERRAPGVADPTVTRPVGQCAVSVMLDAFERPFPPSRILQRASASGQRRLFGAGAERPVPHAPAGGPGDLRRGVCGFNARIADLGGQWPRTGGGRKAATHVRGRPTLLTLVGERPDA